MMTKSFFMRTYNLNIYLFLLSLLTGFLGWLLGFLASTLDLTLPIILDLSQVNDYLAVGSHYSYMAMTYLLSSLFASIMIEVLNRVRFDSLLNYFKSIYHTFKLRNFLTQREKSEKVTTIDNQTITTYNPINRSFNRCAHKSVVDIRKDEVTVFIKVPRDQQGQKVLGDMTSQLKEEVSSQHSDYYFSAPNRVRNNLWLVGKKR
ncbi:TPA: hypothetical protein ACGOA2_001428 [Streptococcus agalactiae]|uniref:hypothetical protein n=1 Tax=Streptococcus TaxID=1301 RepID=UPI00163B2F4E|nr:MULTISPECIES: hypothetical protein [Streptococcus]MCL6311733.1 hypothetical protein [Streptococcus agalactiae]MDY4510433.1 hypothetical protein [Streptococcus hyovaginalis]HEN4578379.1 hypothetical protein [Streptococcus agalactiae]HEN4595425.1 hypothetical protein [Streptococcus agalactiae]HEN4618972.1 hypothetical protein [Streptococcus agalactiae]